MRLPLTKLWLFLLTAAIGLALLPLLVLGPELSRRDVEERQGRLLRAQPVATQLLANQANLLVNAATQMASDAVLQSSLYEMGRGQGELALLHRTAQAQLKLLNSEFAAPLLLVADGKGRVLARLGHDEAVYRDPLDGLPLIEAALRGYRLDDLWLLDGTLYRVAASPVVGPSRDRYVGALVIGQVLGSSLLGSLNRMAGVEGVFVAAGKVLASSLSSPPEPFAVQTLLALRSPGAAVVRGPWPDRLIAFVDLPGEAAKQGAVLALISSPAAAQSLRGLLTTALHHAVRGGHAAPWLLGLLAGVVLLYAIGLSFLGSETATALAQLRALRVAKTVAPPPLLDAPTEPPVSGDAPTLPAPPSPAAADYEDSADSGDQLTSLAAFGATSAHVAETVVAGPLIWDVARKSAESAADSGAAWALPPPSSNFEPTLVAGASPSADASVADGSFYQVFSDYVQLRERCGESVEGLSYEQFRKRLVDSRAQIIRDHHCRTVDFQVYVKEGRAALRATPLWD